MIAGRIVAMVVPAIALTAITSSAMIAPTEPTLSAAAAANAAKITFFACLCTVAVVSGAAWLSAGWISRPLRTLAERLQELNDGRMDREIPFQSAKDLVGEVARAMEVMRVNACKGIQAEAEKAAMAAEQASVVTALAAGLDRLASGDLNQRLSESVPASYAKLWDDFHKATGGLREAMQVIVVNADSLRSGAAEMSQAADDLSRRTEQQAASLEETAATLHEITTTVHRTADGATDATHVVSAAKTEAERGEAITRSAITAMGEIDASAKQISQIIGVIDEIAFQTNLLALNAGVEAARAGDAGRGFAVVAGEVRSLALRSAEAAKEIKGLISVSSTQVAAGVDLVNRSGQALDAIKSKVGEVDGLVAEIAVAAKEQAIALNEVNSAINLMDQVTQQNAAMVEESTAFCHVLSSEAEELRRLVAQFKLGEAAAPQPRAQPRARLRSSAPPTRMLKTMGAGGAAPKFVPDDDESWEEF